MNARALVVAMVVVAACQTRGQAKIVTAGAASVALIGGYLEYDTRSAPISAIGAGTVAIISAISILFLDDHARTFSDSSPMAWEPAERDVKSELLAGIHRMGCFGSCPVYHVAIYRDGEVRYVGEHDVTTMGTAIGHLTPDQVRALEQRLVDADVPSLAGEYETRDCTDFPTVYLWYRRSGGSTSFVAHYLGDRGAPKTLFAIEEALDTAVDVEQWIGRSERHRGPAATFCH